MGKKHHLQYLTISENYVKIFDNERNRIATVYFRMVNHTSWCDLCDESECAHIEFAWTIPKVAEILRKHGFKSPEDKAMERTLMRLM